MKIAGKCKPEKHLLRELYNKGYENVELYLTKRMLDTRTDIITVCENAKINISSVHTPHLHLDVQESMKYFKQTDLIAKELDATFILHSNPYSTFSLINFYGPKEVEAPKFGYENHPDVSSHFINYYQIKGGYPLILDTAHLYIAEKNYLGTIKNLLKNYTHNEIPIIHLNDGTRTKDGLNLGDGTMDYECIIDYIENYNYEGYVTLEVPVAKQFDALNTVENILDKIN